MKRSTGVFVPAASFAFGQPAFPRLGLGRFLLSSEMFPSSLPLDLLASCQYASQRSAH
ncbi:MAG: hypothetical protein NZ602_10055 [Thermoguttaceae bacterium]|nr:hypothetical protein [Thermoguttaceae bacterium]MDW8038113.1 hypothetical protein [Thermoguttaceae bacterium]